MKNLILLLLSVIFLTDISSQGLIVNEISNGTSGTKEFIELLVIGSTTQPIGLIDIGNWVIDDNNGDFEASSGSGVATGHYRFTNTFPLVPIGALIVIYNNGDVNGNMIADDELDSNGDSVYVLPINSQYLERCTSLPSSTLGTSYTPCTYSSSTSQTWNQIGLRNGGDACQIRRPDYTFYHGFSFGDVVNPFPNFPTEFGGGVSFNVRTGSGTSRNYFLDCGDWTSQLNYQRGDATNDTPGSENTINNKYMIDNIRAGVFNYDPLSDFNNCQQIILNVSNFEAKVDGTEVHLSWNQDRDFIYELQRSVNGYEFESIGFILDNFYIDTNPYDETYYRLKMIYDDSTYSYSDILYVSFDSGYRNVVVHPNPFYDKITINFNSKQRFQYRLYDVMGNCVKFGESDSDVYLGDISPSVYLLELKMGNYTLFKKVVKK